MYRLPCAELCSCQFLFINHVSDCQKLFCLQVYFRANSYRYLRIEFQKEDKLTHRRYAPSFERITQWVDKVGQYISVINLGSRYSPRPSAGIRRRWQSWESRWSGLWWTRILQYLWHTVHKGKGWKNPLFITSWYLTSS